MSSSDVEAVVSSLITIVSTTPGSRSLSSPDISEYPPASSIIEASTITQVGREVGAWARVAGNITTFSASRRGPAGGFEIAHARLVGRGRLSVVVAHEGLVDRQMAGGLLLLAAGLEPPGEHVVPFDELGVPLQLALLLLQLLHVGILALLETHHHEATGDLEGAGEGGVGLQIEGDLGQLGRIADLLDDSSTPREQACLLGARVAGRRDGGGARFGDRPCLGGRLDHGGRRRGLSIGGRVVAGGRAREE